MLKKLLTRKEKSKRQLLLRSFPFNVKRLCDEYPGVNYTRSNLLVLKARETSIFTLRFSDFEQDEEEGSRLIFDLWLKNKDMHNNIFVFYQEQIFCTENYLVFAGALKFDGCLTQVISRGYQWPEEDIGYVFRNTLNGIAFLHSNNIMHRDIKSDNILFDRQQGNIRLACFDLCATDLNRSEIVGTPKWMSPEMIEGNGYTKLTDIWSFGITVIEVVDGRPPHPNYHNIRALFQIVTNPAPQFSNPDNSSKLLNGFLRRCMCKRPSKRATVVELLEHEFLLGSGTNLSFLATVKEVLA